LDQDGVAGNISLRRHSQIVLVGSSANEDKDKRCGRRDNGKNGLWRICLGRKREANLLVLASVQGKTGNGFTRRVL